MRCAGPAAYPYIVGDGTLPPPAAGMAEASGTATATQDTATVTSATARIRGRDQNV